MLSSQPYLVDLKLLRGLSFIRLSGSLSQSIVSEETSHPNLRSDISAYAALLKSSSLNLSSGNLIHHHILRDGLELVSPLSSLLVLMYSNCGAIHDGYYCVAILPHRQQNVFTWNFLFKSCAKQGLFRQAFEMYGHMLSHDVMPNKVTFVCMLDTCTVHTTFHEVVHLHYLTMDGHFDLDPVVGTSLLNLYAKVGSLLDAANVFHRICEKDVVTWTSMISVYVQGGERRMALLLFGQMQHEDVIPDKITYVSAIMACDNPLALCEGRHVHSQIVDKRLENDLVIGSALVNMYGKCCSLVDAETTFYQMCQRNVVTWNSLIGVYAQHGVGTNAFQLFMQMKVEGLLPNRETYINMLTGCSIVETLINKGIEIHACLRDTGMDCDIAIGNVLINMYGKCYAPEHARKVFDHMADLNVISWTAMIAVHGQHGEFREAMCLFIKMQLVGVKPNEVTLVSLVSSCTKLKEGRWLHSFAFEKHLESTDPIKNALINMYVQFGSIEDAQISFDSLSERDAISWTAMITALAEHGKTSEALLYYVQMQEEGKKPNDVSFVNILCACATQVALVEGRLLHTCIVENGLGISIDVGNALINLYGKCGSVEDAVGVFFIMCEQRDVVSWNTLLTVFSQHGRGTEAVGILNEMIVSESIPDKLTFASVLSACSHAGLVEVALQLFILAEQNHTNLISQDHYVCMIDLLGRVGRLVETFYLINFMPIQPTILCFMAFLGACQYHVQVELAEDASKCLIEIDEENSAPYVVLSNIYAAIRWKVGPFGLI